MPGQVNTLLIDGSFEELSDELAHYIDEIRKKQGDDRIILQTEISDLLESGQKDEVLKKLVGNSNVLNAAPEKEIIAAYNLLIHLVRQSSSPDRFLARICSNLSSPIVSSPINGPGIALTVLTTIFNVLPVDNESRYHVFLNVLRVIKTGSSFEFLKPQLKNLDAWIVHWEIDEEDQRKLHLAIVEAAEEAGDSDQAYAFLVKALRTIPNAEVDSDEAQHLSIKALKAALSHHSHYDFQDIITLDAIQSLRRSHSIAFELLEIFSTELLDDYNDFLEEHDGWIEEQALDPTILKRKIRLLSLASLAASTPSRSLPYQQIAKALQVPQEDVEVWVIDVIRAGLVEGKLSQLNQTFLIHRSTYRVFGEKQWSEVQGRLESWKSSLEGVLSVVRGEREKVLKEKERELRETERMTTAHGGQGSSLGPKTRRPIDMHGD